MAPRNLSLDSSLDALWYEAAYTRARCLGDSNAAEFAPVISPLIAEIEETRAGQQRMWASEIDAQALCDHLNDRMDDLVADVASTLVFLTRDRDSPRVRLYLRQPACSITRLALRSEIGVIGSWPEMLRTEPEEALSSLAPRLSEVIEQAAAALSAQSAARSARLEHRVRVIGPMIERLNKARFKLYGLLVGRAEQRSLGKHWPGRFFRVSPRKTVAGPADPLSAAVPASTDPAEPA